MTMKLRTIIHVDLDAFYCSIEEQRDPALRGVPFAVGGRPEQRGVIASCSYAARQFGVRSAMPSSRALAVCPGLIIVPSRHAEYRAASVQVMERLRALTPLVEQLSIDEAFVDATELLDGGPQSPAAWALARQLQVTMHRDLRLSCSVGIAANKMVAKIATDFGKARVPARHTPRAIWVVAAGDEAAFLAPLPVTALWGVGPRTAAELQALSIHTIGDLAQWPRDDLMSRFGRHGHELSCHAAGVDDRDIVTVRESKSISCEQTFVHDLRQWGQLEPVLHEQAQSIAAELRRKDLKAWTVKLKLRWQDFTTPTRQTTLPRPTDDAAVLATAAIGLLAQLWQSRRPVRLLGLGVSRLGKPQQLSLWRDEEREETAES